MLSPGFAAGGAASVVALEQLTVVSAESSALSDPRYTGAMRWVIVRELRDNGGEEPDRVQRVCSISAHLLAATVPWKAQGMHNSGVRGVCRSAVRATCGALTLPTFRSVSVVGQTI